MISPLSCALGALLGAGALLGGSPQDSAEADVEAPAPAEAPAPPLTREDRLALQAEQLRARIAKMEALDLADRMAAAIDGLDSTYGAPQYTPVSDGWIYIRPLRFERYVNGPASGEELDPEQHYVPGQHQVATIVDFSRQLEERGIELIVVPIPTRLQAYPELVVNVELDEDFEGFALGLTRIMLELNEQGVEVLDLLPALARERDSHLAEDRHQVFLRANGHWSPKGVVISAREMADRMREAPWFEDARRRSNPDVETFDRDWSYRDQKLAEGATPPKLEFERVLTPKGRIVEYSNDSPVLVLGDSFVSIFAPEGADLPRQLHRFAGFPMDVISVPGGAAQASRATLARRKGGARGKRMVFWLWASESLMMPVGKWKPINIFER